MARERGLPEPGGKGFPGWHWLVQWHEEGHWKSYREVIPEDLSERPEFIHHLIRERSVRIVRICKQMSRGRWSSNPGWQDRMQIHRAKCYFGLMNNYRLLAEKNGWDDIELPSWTSFIDVDVSKVKYMDAQDVVDKILRELKGLCGVAMEMKIRNDMSRRDRKILNQLVLVLGHEAAGIMVDVMDEVA